jgi:hypothetical protein
VRHLIAIVIDHVVVFVFFFVLFDCTSQAAKQVLPKVMLAAVEVMCEHRLRVVHTIGNALEQRTDSRSLGSMDRGQLLLVGNSWVGTAFDKHLQQYNAHRTNQYTIDSRCKQEYE